MIQNHSELRFRAFGSACHITVENIDDKGTELLSLAKSEILRIESKFGTFSSESIVNELNEGAGTDSCVYLDKESQSLFEYASALWHQSNHQFDPSTHILWACYLKGKLSTKLLKENLPLVGWSGLERSDKGGRLSREGMFIDLDSCVRPYTVDSIQRIFTGKGVQSASISLGDDIATIGKQTDGANWLIAVKHPTKSGVAINRLKLNNKAYSVRGDFEKTLTVDNERFGMALSPIDGHPIPGLLSVGVMADTCLSACGAATIAQVKTEKAALKWLDSLGFTWAAIDRSMNCHGLLQENKMVKP